MTKETNPEQPKPFVPSKVVDKISESQVGVRLGFYSEHLITWPQTRRFTIEGFVDGDVDLRNLDMSQIQVVVNGRRLGTVASINIHIG